MNRQHFLYRSDQVREFDRRAIEECGIPGYTLMQRAGAVALRLLRIRWPEARRILVCCGGGNNGGDGYVVARLAFEAGLEVCLLAATPPARLSGDAALAAADWTGDVFEDVDPTGFDVVVDAVLGTGLEQVVREPLARLIERLDQARSDGRVRGVLAIDVPSGLNADTGMPMGAALRADVTVTFIGRKRGLATGRAAEFCGDLEYDDLGVSGQVFDDLEPDAILLDRVSVERTLPPRPAAAHKGQLGHVLVLGSDHNYPGACLLAARAALRAGSGLVSVATRRDHALALAAGLPEAMWADGEDGSVLGELLEGADVLALGPGLGRSEWSRAIWSRALASDLPMVLDADGLNLLAEQSMARGRWILTPHPGEAARLLGSDTAAVQRDRFAAARVLARRHDAVVVLKGAGSLIAEPDGRVAVCPFGTPAMATAGMGDVLTGIIASLIGQGLDLAAAARLGVVLHARAGERAAAGRRNILAGELIEALPGVLA